MPVSGPIKDREIISHSVEYIKLVNSAVYWHRLLFYDLISRGNTIRLQVILVYCCAAK